MITRGPSQADLVGHVTYIEPLKQWGYLHGPAGKRACMPDGLSEIELGDEVRHRVAPGGDRASAVHVLRCTRRDR